MSVQVQHFRLDHLAAAERQELIGEAGCPAGGLEHLFDATVQRIFAWQVAQNHVAVTGDDCQQVVEVVRHAAGKSSDGFHLLRLAELVFELPALRDIDADAANKLYVIIFIQDGKTIDEPVMHAVLVWDGLDAFRQLLRMGDFEVILHEPVRVLLRPNFVVGLPQEVVRIEMEQALSRLIVEDVLSLAVFHEGHAGEMPHEGCEPLLAFTQRFFGSFSLADVDRGPDYGGSAIRVRGLHKIQVRQDPYGASVFSTETNLLLGESLLLTQARQYLIAIGQTIIKLG